MQALARRTVTGACHMQLQVGDLEIIRVLDLGRYLVRFAEDILRVLN